MTLPYERVNAVTRTRDFLLELCEPGKQFTKKELRQRIRGLLRHYPNEFDIDQISECKNCSNILGKQNGVAGRI